MWTRLLPIVLTSTLFLAGCSGTPTGPSAPPRTAGAAHHNTHESADEAKIRANLAKLSPEDRNLAEEQKYCAIESDNPLGAMGVPEKVMVKGQPVFLCCKNCKDEALAHPDETLTRVRDLKEKAGASPR
jgi:hypothetical protein